MKLTLFASAWTFGSLEACRREVLAGYFDGVEGPAPATAAECSNLRREFESGEIHFKEEVCTGGDYAPES